jgi:hypothetical protein
MMKLAMTLTSVLASLGLAGYWPDDPEPPAPPAPPEAPEAPEGSQDVEKRVEVHVVAPDEEGGGTEEALRDAYERLTKLRAERPTPEGRPKEMMDRAADLYRRAHRAYGEARDHEARGLAIAARETARAVERLREVQRGDRPADPDLPPPPGRRRAAREAMKVAVPLPPIPPELPGGHSVPPVPPVPPVPARVRVFRGPEGDVQARSFVFVRPHGDVLKQGDGKAVRKFEVRVDEKAIREQAEQLAKHAHDQAKHAHAEAERARIDAFRIGNETARALAQYRLRSRGGPGEARAELKKAYDRIQKAREEARGDEAKFYLDAARDLYNAARRDAEAGRNDRAIELARAAEALTHVPAHLGAIKEGQDDEDRDTDRPRGDRPERKERRLFERRIPRDEPKDRDRREERDDDEKKEIEIQIETKPEAAAREEAEPDAEKVTGIGVALSVEDGKVVVLNVLPEGPAGQDGRIKKDDELVAVLGDDGEKTELADQELTEIVKVLRGPAGSKVRLLVRPAGDDETAVIELTRAELTVPPHGVAEPAREEVDRAVREAFRELQRAHEDARPAEADAEAADPLPPPLPE